ncbi:ABC transporter substrate-binding protein [Neobacillus muris]|uniref:ABC transporter substrate-binding protein n=1 Tax=Neobacillus muris TaxID=2941334 RepID=UPI00203AAF3D|nr:sugar ABC transporter substrate-binding protein [Neobacillus muris]
MKVKRFLVWGLLLVLSFAIIGCSSSETSKENTDKEGSDAEKVSEKVELTMYSWRPEDREMYEKAIKKFQEKHPEISIDFQPYESTEYNTILSNALVSGDGPDILQLRPYSGATTIADNNYLLPLDDLTGIENINKEYLDAAKGSDGKVYGVPLSLNSGVIFYNKEIFEKQGIKVPKTWDEFMTVCEKLKKNDIIPIAQSGRAAYLLSMTHAVIGPDAYGHNDFVDKIVSGDANLEDPKFVESVQRMKDLEKFFPKDFIALEDNDAQTLFYTGQAAMYINGDYRLATIEGTAPDMSIGVIPGFAAEDGGELAVTTWVDGSYAAAKNTKHPEEAKLFMEFLASKEFGQIFTDESDRLSAINGVTPKHPIVKEISAAAAKHSTPYLMLVHFGEGEPTTKTTFENALQGMYLGKLTVEGVIDEAQKNADRAAKE